MKTDSVINLQAKIGFIFNIFFFLGDQLCNWFGRIWLDFWVLYLAILPLICSSRQFGHKSDTLLIESWQLKNKDLERSHSNIMKRTLAKNVMKRMERFHSQYYNNKTFSVCIINCDAVNTLSQNVENRIKDFFDSFRLNIIHYIHSFE